MRCWVTLTRVSCFAVLRWSTAAALGLVSGVSACGLDARGTSARKATGPTTEAPTTSGASGGQGTTGQGGSSSGGHPSAGGATSAGGYGGSMGGGGSGTGDTAGTGGAGGGGTTIMPVCGNGIIESGEECDDGNLEPGDGCSPECVECECPAGDCSNAAVFRDPITHHCYAYVASSRDWSDAETACEAWSGTLAALSTITELQSLMSLVKSSDTNVWLGATDEGHEGTFVWVNGEAFSYVNGAPPWASDEPNDNGIWPGHENCLEMRMDPNFNDRKCDTTQHFLCERLPAGAPP